MVPIYWQLVVTLIKPADINQPREVANGKEISAHSRLPGAELCKFRHTLGLNQLNLAVAVKLFLLTPPKWYLILVKW
jgi:hypothetical protein